MMKVKMKISGAFRTFDAAQDFATLRSVIATARKQGWNILQTLTHPMPPPSSTPSQPDPHLLGSYSRCSLFEHGDVIGDHRARNAAECEAEKFGRRVAGALPKIQLTCLVRRELLNV